MCGIFGLLVRRGVAIDEVSWHALMRDLFILSESRGREASGIAVADAHTISSYKDSVPAAKLLKDKAYRQAIDPVCKKFFSETSQSPYLMAMGHSRLVTNGLQGIDANNQPVRTGDSVIVHNGIVVNVDELWNSMETQPRADVDTEVIGTLIEKKVKNGAALPQAIMYAFDRIKGETSICLFHARSDTMTLATNTGSLYWCLSKDKTTFFFASERYICEQFLDGNFILSSGNPDVYQIDAGKGLTVSGGSADVSSFDLQVSVKQFATPNVAPLLATQKRIEDKAEKLSQARETMRRCSRCLLPETMPYIRYDREGICTYCRKYQPHVPKDKAELLVSLDKVRNTNGRPDCIVAFSGGRDSSYGLHLLKELGMNPIAYTYDWGMVTDLARRNQARMCGQLGIEHIWLSADIKSKRANIRRNVSAWLKKPDLGMIPLFMAGDKQFFWYANDMMKKTGIDTMVFCTNGLEKTDFKSGFLGVPPKDSQMRNDPSSLGIGPKANMLWQYGKRYLGNPRYLNASLPDTAWAYASYYLIDQSHLYLFDYFDWNETDVDDILINQYDWETATYSNNTWRIGDGTAPFYNHIYLTVAGFTEHDTFRSNQIREGDITRAQGMAYLSEENVTRWGAVRDYCNVINIDFDDAMRVIDRIPKLYAN